MLLRCGAERCCCGKRFSERKHWGYSLAECCKGVSLGKRVRFVIRTGAKGGFGGVLSSGMIIPRGTLARTLPQRARARSPHTIVAGPFLFCDLYGHGHDDRAIVVRWPWGHPAIVADTTRRSHPPLRLAHRLPLDVKRFLAGFQAFGLEGVIVSGTVAGAFNNFRCSIRMFNGHASTSHVRRADRAERLNARRIRQRNAYIVDIPEIISAFLRLFIRSRSLRANFEIKREANHIARLVGSATGQAQAPVFDKHKAATFVR